MSCRFFNSTARYFWLRVAIFLFLACLGLAGRGSAEVPAAATPEFNAYVDKLESRLAQQHQSAGRFLAPAGSNGEIDARLRKGELIIEQLTPEHEANLPGSLLHHWRGTAFVPGATAADFERLMKDLNAYPQRFAPQVIEARMDPPQTADPPDHFKTWMRVRQRHVITVVMETTYDVSYGRLDPQHGYSSAHSTKIAEIGSPGSKDEHVLSTSEEHGFLWRLNVYWSYEERDGGLYMQIESVSLTRSIPAGLAWMLGPYVKSVPRESLEFTLRSTYNALKK